MHDNAASRRPPRQDRSRSTVDAILEAGQRVFGDAGLSATTTRIAHVAGVSVGSLYQYFPGKEAIVSALVSRAVDEDVARVEAAMQATRDQPLEARLRAMIEASLAMPRARPRFFGFMMEHLPLLGHHAEVRRLERELVRIVRRLLDEHPELELADRELAAVASVGAMRGLVDHVARTHPDALPGEALLDLCVALLSGLVRRREPEEP